MNDIPWTEYGSFEVSEGRLVISDPCRKKVGGEGLNLMIVAKAGSWDVHAQLTPVGPVSLETVHCGQVRDLVRWVEQGEWLPVDSAQVGFFDAQAYHPEDEAWYQRCCEITNNGDGVGALLCGVVSATTHGDGDYPVFLACDREGVVVGVRVLFEDPDDRG